MRKCIFIFLIFLVTTEISAQRPLSTYIVSTKVSQECVSFISLTLFEEGSGNDSLNRILINECLGNFMQSKPLRKLSFFYQNRTFVHPDSTFDFNIFSSLSFSKNDIYSFTVCPRYACDKSDENTYETQMMTMDAKTGKILEMKDVFESTKEDTLSKFVLKILNMYRMRNLPVCKMMGFNPNIIATTSGSSTTTDTVTYLKGFTGKFYLSNDKVHIYNKVKHRDYDFTDIEIAIPYQKLLYFMRSDFKKRIELE